MTHSFASAHSNHFAGASLKGSQLVRSTSFGRAPLLGSTGRSTQDTFSSASGLTGSLQGQVGKQASKLVEAPLNKLGAGLLLKGVIPYALLHFPLFKIPFLRDPLLIIAGFVFGKNGDSLLKAIPKNSFKGSLNHIHQLGSENFGRLFADTQQFGQATRLVNKLSLSTLMNPKLPIPWKLIDKLVGWVPINAQKFEGFKKLPWVLGEMGGWLHKSVSNVQVMQGFLKSESRDFALRKQLYKRFIRLHPEKGAASAFRKYMDTHSNDLGTMLGASQAKSLRQAFADAYQTKFDNFSGKLLSAKNFKKGLHQLTKPIPTIIRAPFTLFIDNVIAPLLDYAVPSVTGAVKTGANNLRKFVGLKY